MPRLPIACSTIVLPASVTLPVSPTRYTYSPFGTAERKHVEKIEKHRIRHRRQHRLLLVGHGKALFECRELQSKGLHNTRVDETQQHCAARPRKL